LATPDQIQEQVQLERDAISQGLKKLRENTDKLEHKDYASASVYGIASVDVLIPLLVARIKDTNDRIYARKNGASFKEIHHYLRDVEPEAAACITAKVTMDKVFSHKEESNLVINVTEAIGRAIEDECQMRHYESCAPGLLHTIVKNYCHNAQGTQQKLTVIQTLMNRYDVKAWVPWGRPNRVKLGGWLLDCVIEVTHWFTKEMTQQGRKRKNYIVPTPEFMAMKDEIMYNAELFSPLAWPMLIEPNDWTNTRAGGYLLNEVMRGHDMVRRGNGGCIQGETPLQFLNHIQKVAYRLNPTVVAVAEALQERGVTVGKFLPIIDYPLPNKPLDIADNYDSRKQYRRDAAEVMNRNAESFKKSCRTRMTMEAVARFKGRERFFIPWSFDYRGRAYPIPAFLTPQDTDFGKSLLQFADAAFITPESEEWLAFQVATTYGHDKATIQERLDWVRDNQELISSIGKDPLRCLSLWEGVDEPWQFMAACDEYYHCLIECDRHWTRLPIATDATCSGLQILAGLAKDASTARLVNVIPGDKPQDAYKVVAEAAKPNCPESIRPHLGRSEVKRVVMTVPYNAKPYSNRQYIRDALKEKGIEIDKDDLTATVKAVREAMDVIVPGPMAVMAWIEKEVAHAIKSGKTHLEWVTPSGFVVHQKLNKKLVETIKLQLLGRCEIQVATEDSDKVDLNHHKNATAPNLIHSIDSALLHRTAIRFDAPIALIHDSVLCRATDMSTLSQIVREEYMHIFAHDNYLENWAAQIGAVSEPPIIGDLEPSSVIESTYFFC
jgi:DNA-directed RNA polymerase